MTVGLIRKALREMRGSTIAFAVGLFAFELLLGIILPAFQREFSEKLAQVDFMQRIIAALMGTDVGIVPGETALAMLGWVHPFVLALIWGHATVCCTRFPAGDVDHGTIDLVLALPVKRATMLTCEAMAFLLAGAVVILTGLLGNLASGWIVGRADSSGSGRVALVALNLYFLAMASAGAASLLSVLCDRRGRAVGAGFAVFLISLFLTSMSVFNAVVDKFAVVSLLNFYRPYRILQEGHFPARDLLALLGIAAVCWMLGCVLVGRRDFRIV